MVAGKVGEHRRGKGHAVDAKLIQPVAGDFHRHHLRALGAVLGQLVLHGHRVGRGVGGGGELADKAIAHRAQQRGLVAQ